MSGVFVTVATGGILLLLLLLFQPALRVGVLRTLRAPRQVVVHGRRKLADVRRLMETVQRRRRLPVGILDDVHHADHTPLDVPVLVVLVVEDRGGSC